MSPDIFFGAGDLAPVITDTLFGPGGEPLDLTGATVVIRYRDKDQMTDEVIESVTIMQTTDPATLGDIAWTPVAAAVAGDYNTNWIVTLPGSKPMTIPNDRYLWMQVLPAP